MSMTYRVKIQILTSAMGDACRDIEAIRAEMVTRRNTDTASKDLIAVKQKLNEQRLCIEPTRAAVMTPEQKAERTFARQYDSRMGKLVSWLRLNGIRDGHYGVRRVDGARVKFVTDPMLTPSGVVINVHYLDSNKRENEVEAMQFKPDVTLPPQKKVSLPKPAARALKAAPVKRNTAAK